MGAIQRTMKSPESFPRRVFSSEYLAAAGPVEYGAMLVINLTQDRFGQGIARLVVLDGQRGSWSSHHGRQGALIATQYSTEHRGGTLECLAAEPISTSTHWSKATASPRCFLARAE